MVVLINDGPLNLFLNKYNIKLIVCIYYKMVTSIFSLVPPDVQATESLPENALQRKLLNMDASQ